MLRKSRSALMTAILTTAGLTLAALPAKAEPTGSVSQSLQASIQNVDASFLTAGVVQQGSRQAPPRRGSSAGGQGFGCGIKGGLLFNSFKQANQTNLKGKTGTAIGIFFGGNRHGAVGVMGEVLYAKKGSKVGEIDTDL